MITAREMFEAGEHWTDRTARYSLPILLLLAKSGRTLTYQELDQEVAARNGLQPLKMVPSYGRALGRIAELMNQLSEEWAVQPPIPPLTVLIINRTSGMPSAGIDGFLQRYLTKSDYEQLTSQNRFAAVELAKSRVFSYTQWDEVASYFGVEIGRRLIILDSLPHFGPITLPLPPRVMGGESVAHLELKQYIASHPELFASYGDFDPGQMEVQLPSGDEVDVLFRNHDQILIAEIKTQDAASGELTRGIYQCVKYRAVLRAMSDLAGELSNVSTVLVTPQLLSPTHVEASLRLGVRWQRVIKD